MIVCPVCEHQQQAGAECEVCGKVLVAAATLAPVAVEKLTDLEVTIPQRVGEIPIERAPDVEGTAFAPVKAVPEAPVPDFERTVSDRVGEIPVLPMDELSSDRVEDDGVRTVIPAGPQVCRYCRNVQATGALCEKCGMKLPMIAAAATAEGTGAKWAATVWTRCRKCGATAKGGQKCGDCGHDVPMPEA